MKLWNLLLLVVGALFFASCSFLAEHGSALAEAATDPAVLESGRGVITEAAKGNYFGAAEQLLQLLTGVGATYWLVMKRRDAQRRARGEAYGKEPPRTETINVVNSPPPSGAG